MQPIAEPLATHAGAKSDSRVFRERPLRKGELRAALDRSVAKSLSTVLVTLAWVYIVFALGHVTLLPSDVGTPMTLAAIATASAFLCLRRFCPWIERKPEYAHMLGASAVSLALGNCVLALALSGDPQLTINFILLVIMLGLLFTSTRWVVGTGLLGMASWSAIAVQQPAHPDWLLQGFNLLVAFLVALATHGVRIRGITHRETIRQSLERNANALRGALNESKRELKKRRAAQAAQRSSEKRKAAMLESALDAIVTIDAKGNVVEFNRGAERMFGSPRDHMRGIRFADYFIPEEHRENHRLGMEHYLETGEGPVLGKRVELEGLRLDGSRFPLEISIVPIELGKEKLFTAYIRDLTEVRVAERQLREVQDEQGRLAGDIQSRLLLGTPPQDCSRLDIAALNVPCQDVGGDFYDFFREGTAVEFLLGDVMGKGVPAALVGAATKAAFQSARYDVWDAGPNLERVVSRVHESLTAELSSLERFVTLIYARIEPLAGTMVFVDCGHTATAQFVAADHEVKFLKGEGPPLGIWEEAEYPETRAAVAPGDVLVFYSDGLTEAEDAQQEQLGEKGLEKVLLASACESAASIVEALRTRASEHGDDAWFQDDFTCVVVRILDESV